MANVNVAMLGFNSGFTLILGEFGWMRCCTPFGIICITLNPVWVGRERALINDRYIMTAAHCIPKNSKPSDIIAMLGVHKADERWKEGNGRKKLVIQSYVIHKKYNRKSGLLYDIALLKLKKPVDTTKWNPICLPNFSQYSNLFLIGWGLQNSGGKLVRSAALHEVNMDQVRLGKILTTCKWQRCWLVTLLWLFQPKVTNKGVAAHNNNNAAVHLEITRTLMSPLATDTWRPLSFFECDLDSFSCSLS